MGSPAAAVLVSTLSVLLGCEVLALSSVFSVWLLDAVYELDAAREVEARLAVAEERLRFGRDLHDVMGRNLAVIAPSRASSPCSWRGAGGPRPWTR